MQEDIGLRINKFFEVDFAIKLTQVMNDVSTVQRSFSSSVLE